VNMYNVTKDPEALNIKDAIQAMLLQQPLTPKEVQDILGLDKTQTTNYFTSLKKQGLIGWHESFNTGHVARRKYIAYKNKPKFSEIINQRLAGRQQVANDKREQKRQEVSRAKKNPNVSMVVSIDDYHTKSTRSHKHEWRGYNSMNGL